MWICRRKEIGKLTFRALARRRSESRNCGCVWFIYKKVELPFWLVPGNIKNNNIEWKANVHIVRIKSADLEIKFMF